MDPLPNAANHEEKKAGASTIFFMPLFSAIIKHKYLLWKVSCFQLAFEKKIQILWRDTPSLLFGTPKFTYLLRSTSSNANIKQVHYGQKYTKVLLVCSKRWKQRIVCDNIMKWNFYENILYGMVLFSTCELTCYHQTLPCK